MSRGAPCDALRILGSIRTLDRPSFLPFSPMTDELLTTEEAAPLVGYRPRGLEYQRQHGRGPAYIRLSTGRVRYRREDIAAWLAAQTVVPGPSASAK